MWDKENLIITYFSNLIKYDFYINDKATEDEIRLVNAILSLRNIPKQIAEALMKQLYEELSLTCRTELVKEVNIEITNIYYSCKSHCSGSPRPCKDSDGDVNMNFYTEYVVEREEQSKGMPDLVHGFFCGTTLGRFSRKDKNFREISNSMLDKCQLL